MAQKGKIRELQQDLRISRQAVEGLSKYCDKYKQQIKELEEKVKNLTIPVVSESEVAVCDGCGNHPNTIHRTERGQFCKNCIT